MSRPAPTRRPPQPDPRLQALVDQIRRHPQNRSLHRQRLRLLRSQDNWQPLLQAYREAVGQFPKDAAFWQGLAETAEALGRPTEALDARMKALSLDPSRALQWGGENLGILRAKPPGER